MEEAPGFLSADQLDAMTPAERQSAIDERIVTDLTDLPRGFRERVLASAERLEHVRHPAPEV
jgi:hypothetical protein